MTGGRMDMASDDTPAETGRETTAHAFEHGDTCCTRDERHTEQPRGSRSWVHHQAIDAGVKVIDTLTSVDYATVIAFSTDARPLGGRSTLLKATKYNKERMQIFIRGLRASGGTNFIGAFEAVWAALGSPGSGCNAVVLFMSDGEPTPLPPPPWFVEIEAQAAARGAHVLTYGLGLGSRADPEPRGGGVVLRDIACAANGIYYPVAEDDNLGDVMASYYLLLAPLTEPGQMRLTFYEDVFTEKELRALPRPLWYLGPSRTISDHPGQSRCRSSSPHASPPSG